MNAPGMDAVYIVKASEKNEELRHSLRSLTNLPHRRVWLVGYKPRWVRGVEYVPTVQHGPKHANTWRNWQAMAATAEISDRFVLFNDDFYITRPVEGIPALHRGSLVEMIDWYARHRLTACRQRADYTRRVLGRSGRTDGLLSYELHVPMLVERPALAEAFGWLNHNRSAPLEHLSKRTFYGNWARTGGTETLDVKVMRSDGALPPTDLPFLSTSPHSWAGLAGGWVRRMFDVPSVYEAAPGGNLYRPPTAGRPANVRR